MDRRIALWSMLGACGSLLADDKQPRKLTDAELFGSALRIVTGDPIQELGSIKGYVNIPLGQLESRLKEIPKDKLIITA